MKIKNKVLLSVNADDLVDGVFRNDEIEEVSDKCFYDMPDLKKVILLNVKKIGSVCFSSNQALTSISLPALTTAGSDCFSSNQALTSISLPALTTAGSDCFRYNQALTSISLRNKELPHLCVDGYPFIVESNKTSKGIIIYSGYNFEGMKEKKILRKDCYVARKEGFTASGDTVKQAISDLQFKIVSEKLKNEPIKKDTLITINHYRLVTGACEMGVRDWMEKNGITKDKIKASELLPLLKKTNAYGLDRFTALIDF